MKDDNLLERIVIDPEIMDGKPVIKKLDLRWITS